MTELAEWLVKNGATLLNVALSIGCASLFREMKWWQGQYIKLAEQTLETETAIALALDIELPKRKND